jgi:hypothetical protein
MQAASWVGTISPTGVLSYAKEESRGVWQTMRSWPYAYALGNGPDSLIKGKFDVAPLPSGGDGSSATLGGWNLAVSRLSPNPAAAIDLVRYLASPEVQKRRAIETANLPTSMALDDDPEVTAAQPIVTRWKDAFMQAVPRPSAPTKVKYNEVSSKVWLALHETLSGHDARGRQPRVARPRRARRRQLVSLPDKPGAGRGPRLTRIAGRLEDRKHLGQPGDGRGEREAETAVEGRARPLHFSKPRGS